MSNIGNNKSMMKAKTAFVILLFFLCAMPINFSSVVKVYASENTNIQPYTFICEYKNEKLKFSTNQFLNKLKLSNYQKQIFKKNKNRLEFANKLTKMGFSKRQSLNYALPELDLILKVLNRRFNIQSKQDIIYIEKNKCKIKTLSGRDGWFLDLESVYNQILNQKNSFEIIVKLNLKKDAQIPATPLTEKSCFSTRFESSGEERKHNIKTALEMFDGLILEVGEVLSFNQITGKRSKENGYSRAKIISGGAFVEGYGGGVCQVSTTIYNACLLAGLEVLEVHSHSLPVGYVEPSFDAMVNIGSSDLVVRNNSGERIVITTSSENDICKVKIFGNKNRFNILRKSEKVKVLPAKNDTIETDLSKFENISLEVGEEKRISFAKDGFVSKGYLQYFNGMGELVENRHIRTDTYNPTKGIILKREK